MLSEAKEKFDTLWKFYHGHRWFVLVKKKIPSDKGWGVSKIKVANWLMNPKARDRNGIDDWNITTPAIVKKRKSNSAERL